MQGDSWKSGMDRRHFLHIASVATAVGLIGLSQAAIAQAKVLWRVDGAGMAHVGGIFLTPLLLFMHWANAKSAAAVSALFILVNSVAGLAGNTSSTRQFPAFAPVLVVAAVVEFLRDARRGR